jgi:flagellar export protein FliJ
MRNALATLIRLKRWAVDEQRRVVIAAQGRLDALIEDERTLSARIAHEEACARADMVSAVSYPAFAARMQQERGALALAVSEAEVALAQARDALAGAYREQRTLERVDAERRRRKAAEHARREQEALDEIALRGAATVRLSPAQD